ncbi:hypothetical protein Lesp02_58970 [Lentzea sp. NBRC 105346]|uniref:YkvA family protein n=1 Tax=Lentzea sp. NBRC 105346 TaxID=3032205 RepID=UPI0024A53B94|nr:YkvA family protein [Lentzea sp. NBRC 105346]GLZ33709.1 hypothetical protein Lesp02_58970 [Lentzea sp. NBRC 105346]
MVVFGGFLAVVGLITLLVRDDYLLGLPPVAVGWSLIGVGVVVGGVGIIRARRRRLRGEPHPIGNPIQRLKALPRLVRSMRSGQYAGLPKSRLALWAFALLYLVSPIDVLPELLPIIGVTDDAGVLVWLLTSVSAASGLFLRWEKQQRAVPPAPGKAAGGELGH